MKHAKYIAYFLIFIVLISDGSKPPSRLSISYILLGSNSNVVLKNVVKLNDRTTYSLYSNPKVVRHNLVHLRAG